jgi:rhodanese-related sulfurtransferase
MSAIVGSHSQTGMEAEGAVTKQCRRYGVQQMSAAELRGVLNDEDLRETVQLLDVREPWEAEESSLPHFTLLPLSRWDSMNGSTPAPSTPSAPESHSQRSSREAASCSC